MLDAFVAEARIRWGLDLAAGLQIVASERLSATPVEPSRPLLLVPLNLLRTGGAAEVGDLTLPGRHARAETGAGVGAAAETGAQTGAVAETGAAAGVGAGAGAGAATVLRRLYPAEHAVGRIGLAETATVGDLDETSLAVPLYLSPLPPERALASPWALPWIADRLRRPDGCPWDREQTHASLKKHLLEEAYEVYDELDGGATPELAGELGDLYLQIVLHAQLAAEAGVFDMTDVQESIGRKIVRRHPHVFGDARISTASDVNRQWEQIKRAEREDEAAGAEAPGEVRSALDGISLSMPALAATQEMQERAAHLGYDWPEIVGVLDKVDEELAELAAATTAEEKREEVGDLLLVMTNLARRHGVDAEDALRAAAEKFRNRFRRVERMARERNVQLRDMTFAQLDELWDAAKAEARAEARAEAPAQAASRRRAARHHPTEEAPR